MRNTLTIARKEIKVFFVSPLFYVVSALFACVFGLIFALNLLSSLQASLAETFNITLFLLLLIAPLLSMRMIAQEKQQGTIEWLLTSPVRDVEVVMGKFLALLVMLLAMLGFTLGSVLILLWTAVDRVQVGPLKVGHIDLGTLLVGYLGFALIAAGYLAIGLLASSLTQNQILAAFISFVVLLFIFISGAVANIFTDPVSSFLTFLSSGSHVQNFGRGAISLPDVVYGISLVGIPLYLAVVSLGARRWH